MSQELREGETDKQGFESEGRRRRKSLFIPLLLNSCGETHGIYNRRKEFKRSLLSNSCQKRSFFFK